MPVIAQAKHQEVEYGKTLGMGNTFLNNFRVPHRLRSRIGFALHPENLVCRNRNPVQQAFFRHPVIAFRAIGWDAPFVAPKHLHLVPGNLFREMGSEVFKNRFGRTATGQCDGKKRPSGVFWTPSASRVAKYWDSSPMLLNILMCFFIISVRPFRAC